MRSRFLLDGTEHEVWLSRRAGGYRLHVEGVEGVEVRLETRADPPPAGGGGSRGAADGGGVLYRDRAYPTPLALRASRPPLQGRDQRGGAGANDVLEVGSARSPIFVAVSGDDVHIHLDGRTHLVRYLDPVLSLAGDAAAGGEDAARAPMPGTVVAVQVQPGASVSPGDALVTIESMKLETTVRATRAGLVETVHVREGQSFERDQLLVTMARAG